ncbi:uncharacterized protein LOC125233800 isoform X1 [Leguminivora glycinivorella]|uniref:uncharacterized protein LOC125233800 isoform X1 n=1 Tax=Leguminivora glycinivorella TaxID=1035111 RepID=UPI00200F15C3|nr:uncharacterized protein LOC125233800 isoform X1 [Leguminivora glycinivorella]
MSFAEFIQYQSKRILRATETVTEYIYVKNAMLEKSPSLIPEPDRVSLILEGIQDMRWSTPLATHCCKNVEELITHATAIDNIRRTQRKMTEQQETILFQLFQITQLMTMYVATSTMMMTMRM